MTTSSQDVTKTHSRVDVAKFDARTNHLLHSGHSHRRQTHLVHDFDVHAASQLTIVDLRVETAVEVVRQSCRTGEAADQIVLPILELFTNFFINNFKNRATNSYIDFLIKVSMYCTSRWNERLVVCGAPSYRMDLVCCEVCPEVFGAVIVEAFVT